MLGKKKFVAVYALSGIAGNVLSCIVNPRTPVSARGNYLILEVFCHEPMREFSRPALTPSSATCLPSVNRHFTYIRAMYRANDRAANSWTDTLHLQAVGASGAIFGMVGAWGAFCLMNESFMGRNNSQRALRNIAQTVMINVVYGMSSSQIDNMGHLGVRFNRSPH